MKLIILYGPPAVGKLTIAEKLSKRTGIALFHNHLTRDLVKDTYGDSLIDHYDLVTQLRISVLSYCAKNDTNLIFTYVYAGAQDDKNVDTIVKSVTVYGGEVVFIELTAIREDLINRVSDESRKRYKKLDDPQILENLTENMNIFSIPNVEKLMINTSKMFPDEAVDKIEVFINK